MPEFNVGVPPFFGVKISEEEVKKFWEYFEQIVKPSRKPKDFESLFGKYSRAEAESILDTLYQKYFGRNLDAVGRDFYTPDIQNFGFLGIMWVTHHLVQSDEMNRKVAYDLKELYQKHLYRKPDPVGIDAYDKWIRFFGEDGKRYVENSILKSDEYRDNH